MKLPYFKIKEAFEETRDSFSYGSGAEKLSSAAKLFGKSVANIRHYWKPKNSYFEYVA